MEVCGEGQSFWGRSEVNLDDDEGKAKESAGLRRKLKFQPKSAFRKWELSGLDLVEDAKCGLLRVVQYSLLQLDIVQEICVHKLKDCLIHPLLSVMSPVQLSGVDSRRLSMFTKQMANSLLEWEFLFCRQINELWQKNELLKRIKVITDSFFNQVVPLYLRSWTNSHKKN